MKEKELFKDFTKAFVEAPLAIIFLILDILGVLAVIHWVIDDIQEVIVFLVFILVMFVGQYLVFRRIRLQLANYEQAKPHIEFSKARQAQMYLPSPLGGRMPTYEVLQIWFKNNPLTPIETTIAKDITALITITRSDSSELFEYHGQWVQSNAPDNVGYNGIHDSENIPPSHNEAKLMIALKYTSDSSCYAFTKEGIQSTADGRSKRYEIPQGNYSMRIHLRGIGVDEVFHFQLQNDGANNTLKVKAVT
jgi:hypothetical protein